MSENGNPAPGIVTTHDEFAISWSIDEARSKVNRLLDTSSEEEARAIWRLCSQAQWNYQRAKAGLSSGDWEKQLTPILYRPFDYRWTVFNQNVAVHRRERVMRHMLGRKNLGLITSRGLEVDRAYDQALCTRNLIQHHSLSIKEVNYLFPLYLYPEQGSLFGQEERHPNLSPAFLADLQRRLNLRFTSEETGDLLATIGPEDIFHYMYAVLYSPGYRSRYAEFLEIDFPRVPLTSNLDLFRQLTSLGARLVTLHLLEAPELARPITRYPVSGDNTIGRRHPLYLAPGEAAPEDGVPLKNGRVYINAADVRRGVRAQYFEGVPAEAWEFQVGGHQVCEKWLKDRRGQQLTYDDLTHYQKVVTALAATIELMDVIDDAIEERGGWPLQRE